MNKTRREEERSHTRRKSITIIAPAPAITLVPKLHLGTHLLRQLYCRYFFGALLLMGAAAQAQITLPQAPSNPAPSATPALAPIAPPVPVFPYPMWMVALAAVAALLVIGALIWAVVHYISHRPAPPPPTPRQKARAALEKLREQIGQTEPYPFSIEVSNALREFVSEEFKVRATRQTSPEFLAAASASPLFSADDKALLAAFLEKADLIKFARLAASSADSEALLEQACRFVEGGQVP